MHDKREIIRVVVPGKPVAWARTGGFGTRRFQTKPNRSWVSVAIPLMADALFSSGYTVPLDGPLALLVRVYFALPKTAHRKMREVGYAWHTKTPDASNVLKLVEDAANGVLYHDDKQISRATVEKRSCAQADNRPRVEIYLKTMKEAPWPPR